jgi:hypothetical protein
MGCEALVKLPLLHVRRACNLLRIKITFGDTHEMSVRGALRRLGTFWPVATGAIDPVCFWIDSTISAIG